MSEFIPIPRPPKTVEHKKIAESRPPQLGEAQLQKLYDTSNEMVTKEAKPFSVEELMGSLPEQQPAGAPQKQATKTELAAEANQLLEAINSEVADITEAQEQIKFCQAVMEKHGKEPKSVFEALRNGGLVKDADGNFTGRFTEIDQTRAVKKGGLYTAGNIAVLRRLAATGDKNAQDIYRRLAESDTVLATIKKGPSSAETSTMTLAELDREIQVQAEMLWADKHKDISFATLEQQSPLIAHACRKMAEKNLAAGGISYAFQHKVEATSVAEAKEVTNQQEAIENSRAVADTIIREMADKRVEGDTTATFLELFRGELEEFIQAGEPIGPHDHSREILSVVVTELARSYFEEHPELKSISDTYARVEANNKFYSKLENNPAATYLLERFRHTRYPHEGDITRFNYGELFTSMLVIRRADILDHRAEDRAERAHKGRMTRVGEAIKKCQKFNLLNTYEAAWLEHIDSASAQPNSNISMAEEVQNLADALKFSDDKVDKIFNYNKDSKTFGVVKYLDEKVPDIAKRLYGENTPAEKEESLRKLFRLLPPDFDKYEKDGFFTFNKGLALMFLIQIIQGELEFSGDDAQNQPTAGHR